MMITDIFVRQLSDSQISCLVMTFQTAQGFNRSNKSWQKARKNKLQTRLQPSEKLQTGAQESIAFC